MTREDAEDFLKYFESHCGAHAILFDDLHLPWTHKPSMHFCFQRMSLFGKKLSLRYRVLEAGDIWDDTWKVFDQITFGYCDELDMFGNKWDAMMSQAKSVSRQGYTFAFFPNDFDCIDYVDGKKRVGETFTLPCASSVAEMELKLAITQ